MGETLIILKKYINMPLCQTNCILNSLNYYHSTVLTTSQLCSSIVIQIKHNIHVYIPFKIYRTFCAFFTLVLLITNFNKDQNILAAVVNVELN